VFGRGFNSFEFSVNGEWWCSAWLWIQFFLSFWSVGRGGIVLVGGFDSFGRGFVSFEFSVSGEWWCKAGSWVRFF
jgi:hypothetical protein